MIQRSSDRGYILASALALLFGLSLTAAALVSVSTESLRRVVGAEHRAAQAEALRSAILIGASQLAIDPRRRQLAITDGTADLKVSGSEFRLLFAWETAKLDANLAAPEEIAAALTDAGLAPGPREVVIAALRDRRSAKSPLRLVDDLSEDSEVRACLRTVLTVFGGRSTRADPREAAPALVQPPAGAKVAIEARPAHEPEPRLIGVVMLTGNSEDPVRMMDIRRPRGNEEEACHAR